MKRWLSAWIFAPLLTLGFAAGAHAQSADDADGLLAFALWGLTTSPDQPRDFSIVVFWIIYGSQENDDPYMVNDLNLIVSSSDDTVDPSPL